MTALNAFALPWLNHKLKPAALNGPGSLTRVSVTKDISLSAVWCRMSRTRLPSSVGSADSTSAQTPATVGVALDVPPNWFVNREPSVKSELAPAPSLSVVTMPSPAGWVCPRSSQLSEGAHTLIWLPQDE